MKIYDLYLWVCSGSMGVSEITNYLINLDIIEIIQFWRHLFSGSTGIRINLDLIKIIKFCLKIYDLFTRTYGWVYGSMGGVRSKSYCNSSDLRILSSRVF